MTKVTKQVEQSETTERPVSEVSVAAAESVATVDFPTLYFAFNSVRISSKEEAKMQQILHLLQDNPKLNIIVTGWCDTVGSDAVNLPKPSNHG